MATNCPQLLNPRACRSALCCRTAVSKPVREMSCKICEKMLHTRFKAEPSSDSSSFDKLNLSETLSLLLPGGAQHSGVNLDENDPQTLFVESPYGDGDTQAAGEARGIVDRAHRVGNRAGASVLPEAE